MKKPTVYILIVILWILLLILFYPQFAAPLNRTTGVLHLLVVTSTLFICYFWLNGLKDVVYTLYYYLRKPRLKRPAAQLGSFPPVELVYLTCNDFDSSALLKSMQQHYPNFRVVICDDSTNSESREAIDRFQSLYPAIQVVRRRTSKGFKAGNLNNYLTASSAAYFVILDSDEVIPSDFITSALGYFTSSPSIGIVQANHIVSTQGNKFVKTFARGVESHWATYQTMKNTYGFLSFLGHGAMLSAECYKAAGGFPEVVAEDLCFSIRARERGYYTIFAPEIVCEEEYPISYLAFKRRHNKWTQGNMEFIKKYTFAILCAKMTWFEKLDIFLFTYNLPLTAVFVFYIIINIILFPLYQFSANYPLSLYLPTLVFLVAPMLNDIIYYRGKVKHRFLITYCSYVMSLYGSMLYISLRSSIFSLFGKSVFLVTPKTADRITLWGAVVANRGEITFALVLSLLSITLSESLFPVFLLVVPALHSIPLTLMSNEA
jgi:cellulose synthase/poly-beta-1,6-N-acetylglucosamine synthase-like glycosyltransferase